MASSSTEFPSVALQAALAQAIATGTFSDTAYYLFTRRLNSSANHGKVGIPRAVYASSTVMQAAGQHFRGQLSAGFSSTNEVLRETDEYGYESDSDLEDEEWEDELVTASSGLSSPSSKGKEKASELEAKLAEEGEEIDLGLQPIVSVERMVTPQLKHTVIITDVAADTWQAMINYIYTGKIYFAPLRSQGTESRLQAIERHTNDHPYGPPLCSPKSIYRLADKVGLLSLQKLAEQDIKNKILNMSILEEVFSKFSSRYPDILKIEVERIFTHGLSPNDMLLLQQKIKSVALGELPHATNAMMGLLERLPLGSGIPAPSNGYEYRDADVCDDIWEDKKGDKNPEVDKPAYARPSTPPKSKKVKRY
ncbi:hypothetical protein C8Q75DRAFT_891279 [Abortiporus biennis]|nr:hypothetical protein C8Q75DRAFT_891279 [Abortiporus biennis]